jgi:CHRD domain
LAPPAAGNPGSSSGCVAVVPAGIVAAIRANPQNFYVNVHTLGFPLGAIRGQLF